MDLKTRYVVKGVNQEKIMNSKVFITTEGDKIARLEDHWDGELNEGGIKNVSGVDTAAVEDWNLVLTLQLGFPALERHEHAAGRQRAEEC